ncbi:MAG: glycosyl transferase, family 39 [Myxococcales bacterium]|nr:glycosyl transferase, family 39 [Myxococcales bacterium]
MNNDGATGSMPKETGAAGVGWPRPAVLSNRNVLLGFLVVVAGLRLGSFFESVRDWDESLYLLVADQWLQGHAPYTVVWDNKPPGIYAIFALTLEVFGRSIFAVRAIACVSVAVTSTFVFRIGALLERDGWVVGLLAGGCYTVLSLNNGGMAANTEIFFCAPSAAAFYVVLSTAKAVVSSTAKAVVSSTAEAWPLERAAARLGGAGLLLGLAFEIKYVVIFDIAMALAALALVLPWRASPERSFLAFLKAVGALGLGALLPFVIVTLVFRATGHFDEYWTANFTANRARTIAQPFQIGVMAAALRYQLRNGYLFWIAAPVGLGVLAARGRLARLQDKSEDRWFVSTVGLGLLVTLGCFFVVFRTAVYPHYFLQLAIWLALLAAFTAVRLTLSREPPARGRPAGLRVLLVVAAVLLAQQAGPHVLLGAKDVYFRGVLGRPHWGDRPAAVAAYLAPRLRPDDAIYVVDDQPVIYFLTGARLPTPFVFPPLLVRIQGLPDIAGVSPLVELARIMDGRPTYVLKLKMDEEPSYLPEDQRFIEALRARLARDYVLEQSIEGLDLFRVRTSP